MCIYVYAILAAPLHTVKTTRKSLTGRDEEDIGRTNSGVRFLC